MRPDEHKKRKNAQYKQKHNVAGDSKVKDKQSSKKDVKSTNEDCKEEVARETKDVGAHQTSITDEAEVKHYQRKKLESNWNRYTEISSSDDDDLPMKRGEDFNKMFAQAGGSAAQFRFKDEEEWDHDQKSATVGTLDLDLHGLIMSLDCIPLHQRLGIEGRLFSQDQMNEILSCSSKNKEEHDNHQRQQKTSQPTIEYPSNEELANDTHLNSKDHRTQTTVEPDANTKTPVKNGVGDEVISAKTDTSLVKPAEVKALEDDLDALLGLSDTQCTIIEEHNTETVDEDTDVDKHVDVVENTKSVLPDKLSDTGIVEKKVAVSENGTPKKKGDNLEDWLDDFLDD